jgi:hypothetical protein
MAQRDSWYFPHPGGFLVQYNALLGDAPLSIQGSGRYLEQKLAGRVIAEGTDKKIAEQIIDDYLGVLWYPMMLELNNGVIPESWIAEKEEAFLAVSNALMQILQSWRETQEKIRIKRQAERELLESWRETQEQVRIKRQAERERK